MTGRRGMGMAAVAAAALLAGCAAVGPDYPGPPNVAEAAVASPAFLRADPQATPPAPPPARWWEAVGDPLLTRLIDEAFAASPTLQSAEARLRSARAQQALAATGLLPTGGASARYVRGRIPTGSLLPPSSGGAGSAGGGSSIPDPIVLASYSVSADASWEIDLFGGKRRNLESAGAAAEAQEAAYEDAQVSLASQIAQAYAQLREAQNQLALAQRSVRIDSDSLALMRQRRERGTVAEGDVARVEAEWAQARAEVPGLQAQVVQALDQIAVLAGREPGAFDALLAVPEAELVAQPMPPATMPVGTPADWLRRRPDIRQAERTLAARNAAIGSNAAALFPSVNVIGLVASTAAHPADLFSSAAAWAVSPALTWNFLDIPAVHARTRAAEAERDASLADYRRTVLAALQDANDALARFGRQRQTLALREAARDASLRAERFARQRFERGTISLIDALDAERQRVQADAQWAQAGADVLVAYVAVQKNLGLGWSPAR